MARYKDAIEWMAWNDDTEFLDDEYGSMSVTASLVCDLFEKDAKTVRADLVKAVARARRKLELDKQRRAV